MCPNNAGAQSSSSALRPQRLLDQQPPADLSWPLQPPVLRFRHYNDVRFVSSIARSVDSASAGVAGPRSSFCFCFAANIGGSLGTEQTGTTVYRKASRQTIACSSAASAAVAPARAAAFAELA